VRSLKQEVLGVRFDALSMEEAASRALALAGEAGCHYVVTPNAEIVWLARRDPALSEIINKADLVLPDGVGVIHASRIVGRPLRQKVAGIDFAAALMEKMAGSERKLFLLGAKPGVAELAAQRLRAQYPGLLICGVCDGYFRDDVPVVARLNDSGADVVFVCLGAPKQECWMAEHRAQLSAHLLVGLGGSLDVFAGNVSRAPERWQRLGLEWFYRLLQEPRRFGRMCRLPMFLCAAVGDRLRGR
jgi:N-acetylglucosaminyldiphosphoundecaprenol N-acetyl-beta-D-mannosaminyltransferase